MLIEAVSDRDITLQTLRLRYDVTLRGIGLGALVRLMSDHGVRTRPLSIELDQLSYLRTPCILHWRFNHYVVFEGVQGDRYSIVDPASGRRCLTRSEIDRQFTGVVLEPVGFDETTDFGDIKRGLKLRDLLPSIERIEPPRDCRRPFSLNYAAMGASSSMA